MITRRSAAHRPQLTFTADFHELTQGDLVPGTIGLRYDPWRIVPPAEIAEFPTSGKPVHAYAKFHPTGQYWEGDLWLHPGVRMDVIPDPAAQGPMLTADLPLAPGAEGVELWFSYVNEAGQSLWDSNGGKNYLLRFPTHDLDIVSAEVKTAPDGASDRFSVIVNSKAAVDSVTLRWRLTRLPNLPREERPLVASTHGDGDKTWAAPDDGFIVPHNATVAYDLVYTIGDRKFTDDNEGTWYLAGLD